MAAARCRPAPPLPFSPSIPGRDLAPGAKGSTVFTCKVPYLSLPHHARAWLPLVDKMVVGGREVPVRKREKHPHPHTHTLSLSFSLSHTHIHPHTNTHPLHNNNYINGDSHDGPANHRRQVLFRRLTAQVSMACISPAVRPAPRMHAPISSTT